MIDVGCGGGRCLAGLRATVGLSGHVIGGEEVPVMVELARGEVGWREVRLLAESAERFRLPEPADAALACAVRDVLIGEGYRAIGRARRTRCSRHWAAFGGTRSPASDGRTTP